MLEAISDSICDFGVEKVGKSFKFDGKVFTPTEFSRSETNNLISVCDVELEYYKTHPSDRDKVAFWREVLTLAVIKTQRKKQNVIMESIHVEGDNTADPEEYFRKFYPTSEWSTGIIYLVDRKTKKVSDLSHKAWEKIISNEEKSLIGRIPISEIVFDPYDVRSVGIVEKSGVKVHRINTYVSPPWRTNTPEAPKIPEIFDKVFNHLFTKESKEYILDWLRYALVSRNETFLVLNGGKGIGKGVFCSICRSLVGHSHFAAANEGFLSSRFNAVLAENRIILMDEERVTPENHKKLKRIVNEYQNIERKGLDAVSTSKTFNSFIIVNNDTTDMYLEHDDRRFSVPDFATTEDLKSIMSPKDINDLILETEDENSKIVNMFGNFILDREPSQGSFVPFKGDKFYELVDSSLYGWEKAILDEILEGRKEILTIATIRKKYENIKGSAIPTNSDKITDFLKNFKRQDGLRVGEVFKEDGDRRYKIKVASHVLNGDARPNDEEPEEELGGEEIDL